jgi:hypothetical protein
MVCFGGLSGWSIALASSCINNPYDSTFVHITNDFKAHGCIENPYESTFMRVSNDFKARGFGVTCDRWLNYAHVI